VRFGMSMPAQTAGCNFATNQLWPISTSASEEEELKFEPYTYFVLTGCTAAPITLP
jgi:hypothetical protein